MLAIAIGAVAVLVLMPRDRQPRRGAVGDHPGARRTSRRPRIVLGHSVRGRPIYAAEVGDRRSARRLLVVGCIHGDEPAGIAIARAIGRETPRGVDVWVVDDLNPDGVASHTRQNANGVDLNRNFPAGWRPLGVRGDQQYSGPAPFSEPEARIARSLVARLRPSVSVWFHQPLAVVDESGGDVGVERHFARLAGLPVRRLQRYPGSAVGWENRLLPHGTAFVVELPAGPLPRASASRYGRALVGRR